MTHFEVAVGEYLPFLRLRILSDRVLMSGPLAEVFHTLSLQLNFTYTLHKVPGNSWGIKGPNGWTGMLGMVARNEVDLAIGPFTITYDRWSSFKLSYPLYADNVKILVTPSEWKMSLFSAFSVFSVSVWIAIFVAWVTITFTMTILNQHRGKYDSFTRAFVETSWKTISTLLQKGDRRKPDYYLQALLGTLWMISALVISSVFGCIMLTTLFIRRVKKIDSVDDLVASPSIQPILENHSSIFGIFKTYIEKIGDCLWLVFEIALPYWHLLTVAMTVLGIKYEMLQVICATFDPSPPIRLHYFLQTSEADVYRTIFERVSRNPDTGMQTYENMSKAGMDLVLSGSAAMITDGMGLKGFISQRMKDGLPCNYWLAKETVFTMWKVIAFNRNFSNRWMTRINKQLMLNLESGWLQTRMSREYGRYEECISKGSNELSSLDFQHTKGIFLIWIIGCAIAISVLMIEYVSVCKTCLSLHGNKTCYY